MTNVRNSNFVCSVKFTEQELNALLHAYRSFDHLAREHSDKTVAEIVLENGVSLEEAMSARESALHHLGLAGMKIMSVLAKLEEVKETHEC